jgi:hypothetical protein
VWPGPSQSFELTRGGWPILFALFAKGWDSRLRRVWDSDLDFKRRAARAIAIIRTHKGTPSKLLLGRSFDPFITLTCDGYHRQPDNPMKQWS